MFETERGAPVNAPQLPRTPHPVKSRAHAAGEKIAIPSYWSKERMEKHKGHPKDDENPKRKPEDPVKPLGDINSPGADPNDPPPDDENDGDINSPGKTGGG